MNILFIPNVSAIIPHLVPLMALESQLDKRRHKAAFLIPRVLHKSLMNMGRHVLDIDYQAKHTLRDNMLAIRHFRPDVVVDDLSSTALLATKLAKIPRVTIRRTGVFPDTVPRNATHRHSMDPSRIDFNAFYGNTEAIFGIRPPRNIVEMCAAEMNIVPGISSVETISSSLCDDSTYVFAGALILPDSMVPRMSNLDNDGLQGFLGTIRNRQIVLVTLGSVLKPTDAVRDLIKYMLDIGLAVISTVEIGDLEPSRQRMFFYSPFLPMHAVCSRVRLMVHHCGSGTYQYSIVHKVPSLCIGSQCYDRDDVAQRLEELGVAKYVPSAEGNTGFTERFRELLDECLGTSDWYDASVRNLALLKAENDRTAAAFNFEKVVERAVAMQQ